MSSERSRGWDSSISEDFLCRYPLDRSDFFQRLHVQLLLVAKDDVLVRFVGNVRLLEVDDVLQLQSRQSLVNLLVQRVVESQPLCCEIRRKDAVFRCTCGGQALHQALLGEVEAGLTYRHIVE